MLERARRFSFGGVMTDDGVVGGAVARFDRTWPPPAGAVSFGETVAPPAGLMSTIETLLGRIGWRGIFELEYLESADGRRHAIDLNPRVFGWLALATSAGANLAALWCGAMLGRRSPRATARPGVLYRWEEADAAHLAWQLRRGRVRAAAAVARPHRAVVHAHFRLRDPGPLFARALRLAADRVI
jgi:predicted ATP-grasp superfamily ATP-dependent carboligase